MNIVNPLDTNHTLQIVPRFYPVGSVAMVLTNEETKQDLQYITLPVILDGYLYINFEQVFINNTSYQVKIEGDSEIVYRGKLFVTSQSTDTQNYKISNDVFTI